MSERSINTDASPWHKGEVEMQRTVGVAERMLALGRRVVRTYMPDQHREFFAQLPFLVVGTVDHEGDPWAALIPGVPGFLNTPTETTLRLRANLDPHDPIFPGLHVGAAVGLLGIELTTRRRNRLNGVLTEASPDGFVLQVRQSFGNCPQYIQLRDYEFVRKPGSFSSADIVESRHLTATARNIIRGADTFFVASYINDEVDTRQVDVSHRGGNAGFVRIGEDGTLTIPEFAGNLFFATLGNFLVNPRGGLIFIDFESGDVLQLTGRARVDLTSPEINAFRGSERQWHFMPSRIIFRKGALPLRWKFETNGWSPNSLMTGSWDDAERRLKAAALADTWRPLKVTKIVDESRLIRSFVLEPADGAGLIVPLAGQHLPIRVKPPGYDTDVFRTYTLSSGPADPVYRISVKKEGLVSSFLHDHIREGDAIDARSPSGKFTLDALERRPAVLLAAGVGVTPMLAMLRHIVFEGLRTRRVRPTWFFLSARSLQERAFEKEIVKLAEASDGAVEVIRLLTDTTNAERGKNFDEEGRINISLLSRKLPLNDYDFYMCGPTGFMQSIYDGLRDINVADDRIHAESFGPSSLKRRLDKAQTKGPVREPATITTPVAFVKSGKEARWNPDEDSLLELAESRGLSPEFGCRSGSCGSCRTRIVEGEVAYRSQPEFDVDEGEALICCAVPASEATGGGDRLLLDL
ncbi:pyridoxamine 5'-phosphate oxidase family protein [Paraburkholderia sp. BCC1884]|uniref:2Fe-2S iron-sulfur cluster-binding protein n=1 Tax=Paraburkholderia sp. BCC1884 TaxID=2562668 RepID=UPI0011837084|nr:pyridoxamine 5'-phosphate oxidase family protein [Paraburkholderia sp. BCC1884]